MVTLIHIRWVNIPFIGALLLTGSSLNGEVGLPGQKVVQRVDYERFLALVAEKHPQNELDRIAVQKSSLQTDKVGLLPPTQFAITGEDLQKSEAKENSSLAHGSAETKVSSKWTLSVTQGFPWPGTFQREKAQATLGAYRETLLLESSKVERVLSASLAYLELLTIEKLIAIERENLRQADSILKSAEMRMRFGTGSFQDTLDAHHSRVLLDLSIQATTEKLHALKDSAAQWMGFESADGIDFVLDPRQEKLAPPSLIYLGGGPRDFSRELLKKDTEITLKKRELETFRAYPSFMAGAMLMDDGNMMNYGVMIGMNVPLFGGSLRSRIGEEVILEEKRLEQERLRYLNQKKLAQRTLARKEKVAKANYIGLTTKILPRAEEHLKTALRDYALGKAALSSVNLARGELLRFQQARIFAERDLAGLAIENLRLEYGFLDSALDASMPELNADSGMGAGRGMNAMNSSMNGSTAETMQPRGQTSSSWELNSPRGQKGKGRQLNSEEEVNEMPANGSMGGM